MPQIVILGEALIDLFAEKGLPFRAAKTFVLSPGGAPANVAVGAARLGADVGFMGKVGVDEFGALLIELLAGEGIDTTYFVADPRAPTMLSLVASPSSQEQNFIIYTGASALLSIEDIPPDYIASAAVLVYGPATLASDSRDATTQAVRWARDAGNHVIFDANLRPAIWPDPGIARQRIEAAIASATVVKLNEHELKFFTGITDPALGSRSIIARGVQLCCVSMGAEGAYFTNGLVSGHVPAFKVQVVDTTGSGDAFVAGLAYQLCRLNRPLLDLDERALRNIVSFANACGGLAATGLGAMSALPNRDAVENLLLHSSEAR